MPVVGLPNNNVVWECGLNMVDQPAEGDYEVGTVKDDRMFRFAQLPGRNVLPGNCSLGQLTSIGHEQHKTLGAHFRALYHDTYGFLPSQYNADDVWVRAINIPRCRQSAQSEIEGMFTPYDAHDEAHDPAFQVVPVLTMDPGTENMSPNFGACPNLIKRVAALQTTPEWAAFEKQTAGLTQSLLQILKYKSASVVGSVQYPFYIGIYDDFACRNCHDLDLPEGIDQHVFDQIVDAGTFTVNHWLFNETMASIGVGSFFGELIDAMAQVVDANGAYSGPKLRLYGGQDLTVGPLLNCLNVFDNIWPPYASHVSLETWTDAANKVYVRILYNGAIKTIPGCAEFCPWDTFLALTSKNALSPAQYKDICGVVDPVAHIDMFA